MNARHIPRHREPILPRWTDLHPLVRIVAGVAIGLPIVLAAVRSFAS